MDYIGLFEAVDHLPCRKNQGREPVDGKEVLNVIQRRLLSKIPSEAEASPAKRPSDRRTGRIGPHAPVSSMTSCSV
jgi:hypothetical protein